MPEEVDVVNRVGLSDANVGARPFESGEPSRGVANAADPSIRESLAQGRGHGGEAEYVTDLDEMPRDARRLLECAAFLQRAGERLFDETGQAGGEAILHDRQVAIRRGHDVGRIDTGERLAVVERPSRRFDTTPERPLEASGRDVRRPERHPEPAEYSQMLFTPAAQTDQQDIHRASISAVPDRPTPIVVSTDRASRIAATGSRRRP